MILIMKQRYIFHSKIIYLFGLYACLCLTTVGHAQDNDLLDKAKELVYSDPDESIKIAEHILRTHDQLQEVSQLHLIIAQSYLVKGNMDSAIKYAFKNSNHLNSVAPALQVEHYIFKATLLRQLYLDSQSQDYVLKAKALSEKVKPAFKDPVGRLIALEQINYYVDRRLSAEAFLAINEEEKRFKSTYKASPDQKIKLYLAKVKLFNNTAAVDSAATYLHKTLSLIPNSKINNLQQKALAYKELGRINLNQKAFDDSERNFFIASRFAEIIGNVPLLLEINKYLSISYLASNKKSQHKVYNDKFMVLNTQTELIEQEAVNTFYNLITEQNEIVLHAQKQTYTNYGYILWLVVLVVVLIAVFIVFKSEARKKRLNEIINYIEITKNNFLEVKPTKKVSKKRINIPEETEKTILAKLKRFESSKRFLNKDMSLAVLAGQFETNTKYLSGVINKHYNDNFNTFINKLRINYIITKLKNDSNYINYKISFLAEESGYGSHSSFATVFKSVVGMSPVTFIKLIQEERKANQPKSKTE